ncbi:hypothetical protein MHY1_03168 [Methylovirgula sp. HY1]|nr:hypothetical protein MHY1_03168 [Methylovirgula sp. HY1]
MTPFTVLILVCSMALDHAACQPNTAVDVIRGPKIANEMQCGKMGQATLAANGAALAPRPGLEYVKIVCAHSAGLDAPKTADLH